MWCASAFAWLLLLAPPARSARAAQEAVKVGDAPGSGSWTARLRAAASDPATRAGLLRDLRDPTTFAAARVEPGFAAAHARATYLALADACDDRSSPDDVHAALEQARAACAVSEAVRERWQTELTYAAWLIDRGALDEASRILDAFPANAEGLRVEELWRAHLFIEIARCRLDVEAARAVQRRVPPPAAGELEPFEGLQRAKIQSSLGCTELEAGVPDLAARAFAAERELVERMRDGVRTGEGREAWVRVRLDEARLAIASEITRTATARCEEVLAAPFELDLGERIDALALLGTALVDGSRVSSNDERRAREVVDEVATLAAEVPEIAAHADLLRADLELRAGDFSAAESSMDAAARMGGAERKEHRGYLRVALDLRIEALRVQAALAANAPRDTLVARRDALARTFERHCAGWEATPTRPGGVGFLQWGTQRLAVAELMHAELALDPGQVGRERALDVLVRAQSVGSLSRALSNGALTTFAECRRELVGPGRGLVILFPSIGSTDLFLVDDRSIEHLTLASRDRIVEQVIGVNALLLSPPTDAAREMELRERLESLRRAVLPDEGLARMSEWSEVVVFGGESCANLPWEALPIGGSYLGLEKSLSAPPSISAALWLSHRARGEETVAPHDLVLAYAPAVSASVSARFPGQAVFELSPDESRTLIESVADGCALSITSAELGRDALASADVAGASVLVVFAHGVYRADEERPAALLVAPASEHDGVLTCDDIERYTSTPSVVLLLSCGVGRGPSRIGDDAAVHLGSAFLLRGSDCAVVTRAALSLDAAVVLAREFVRALGDPAVTPAEALRLARRALHGNARFADPYHWANASLAGVGFARGFSWRARTEPANERGRLLWIGAGLVTLVGASLFAVRRRAAIRTRGTPSPSPPNARR